MNSKTKKIAKSIMGALVRIDPEKAPSRLREPIAYLLDTVDRDPREGLSFIIENMRDMRGGDSLQDLIVHSARRLWKDRGRRRDSFYDDDDFYDDRRSRRRDDMFDDEDDDFYDDYRDDRRSRRSRDDDFFGDDDDFYDDYRDDRRSRRSRDDDFFGDDDDFFDDYDRDSDRRRNTQSGRSTRKDSRGGTGEAIVIPRNRGDEAEMRTKSNHQTGVTVYNFGDEEPVVKEEVKEEAVPRSTDVDTDRLREAFSDVTDRTESQQQTEPNEVHETLDTDEVGKEMGIIETYMESIMDREQHRLENTIAQLGNKESAGSIVDRLMEDISTTPTKDIRWDGMVDFKVDDSASYAINTACVSRTSHGVYAIPKEEEPEYLRETLKSMETSDGYGGVLFAVGLEAATMLSQEGKTPNPRVKDFYTQLFYNTRSVWHDIIAFLPEHPLLSEFIGKIETPAGLSEATRIFTEYATKAGFRRDYATGMANLVLSTVNTGRITHTEDGADNTTALEASVASMVITLDSSSEELRLAGIDSPVILQDDVHGSLITVITEAYNSTTGLIVELRARDGVYVVIPSPYMEGDCLIRRK